MWKFRIELLPQPFQRDQRLEQQGQIGGQHQVVVAHHSVMSFNSAPIFTSLSCRSS